MIPYGKHHIDEEDIQAVVNVLRSGALTQGPAVEAFEQAIAEYVGAKYAVAVSSGTAALHLAALAAGVGALGAGIVGNDRARAKSLRPQKSNVTSCTLWRAQPI